MVKKWEVGFSEIRGNPGSNDFYTIIQKMNQGVHIGKDVKYKNIFYFDTKEEAEHFLNFLKLPMVRFCLSIYKVNESLNRGASVPYMPTYTRSWTDEDVAKELGLTDEELQWALKWIPNYYDTDKINYSL